MPVDLIVVGAGWCQESGGSSLEFSDDVVRSSAIALWAQTVSYEVGDGRLTLVQQGDCR